MSRDGGQAASILGGQPTYLRVLTYALPLALGGLAMNLEQPIISGGITRLPHPEVGLAAFGVAVSVAWWVESPIIMLIDLATARGVDRPAYQMLRRYSYFWCALVVAVMGLVAWTPLSGLILGHLLGVSQTIAREAVDALRLLLIWPALVGWRRVHQGILIRQGHTRIIGYCVALRLATTTSVVIIGALSGLLGGTILGAVAMNCGLGVETATVYFATRRVIRRELAPKPLEADGRIGAATALSFGALNRYYLPLAGSSVLYSAVGPIITAGLARSSAPAVSLAVWPVAYSMVQTVASPLNGLQQVAIRLGAGNDAARLTRRFTLGGGALFSLLLCVANFTGATALVLRSALGLPPGLDHPALMTVWLLTPVPLIFAARSLGRGILIRFAETRLVQFASAANLCVVAIGLLGGVWLLSVAGYELAGAIVTCAAVCEAALLSRRALRRLPARAEAAERAKPRAEPMGGV